MSADREFFQRIYNNMTPLENLPETGLPGDLVKLSDGTTWVWTDRWILVNTAMQLVYQVQNP